MEFIKKDWTLTTYKAIDINMFIANIKAKETINSVYIGTDSQYENHQLTFVTALAITVNSPPAYIAIRKSILKQNLNLHDKLIYETWMTINTALELREQFDVDIIVHMDVNKNNKHQSYRYKNEVIGYCQSFGLKYEIKPNSWCSSSVADRFTR